MDEQRRVLEPDQLNPAQPSSPLPPPPESPLPPPSVEKPNERVGGFDATRSTMSVLSDHQRPPLWPFLLVLAVFVLAVIGGYLYSLQRGAPPSPTPSPTIRPLPTPIPTPSPLTYLEQLQTQGESDALSAIEVDLNATDFSRLTEGLSTIEADLLNI